MEDTDNSQKQYLLLKILDWIPGPHLCKRLRDFIQEFQPQSQSKVWSLGMPTLWLIFSSHGFLSLSLFHHYSMPKKKVNIYRKSHKSMWALSNVDWGVKWLEKFRRRKSYCGLESLGKSSDVTGSKEWIGMI